MENPITKHIQLSKKSVSPFYSALMDVSHREVVSFHALPIANIKSIEKFELYHNYVKLLSHRSSCESTVTSPYLDSLASPSGCLLKAQEIAAELFNADQTLFITGGSTLSNQIAVQACCNINSRVIMQRGLHQSLHFAVSSLKINTKYIDDIELSPETCSSSLNLIEMKNEIQKAERIKKPFDVAIINSQTYEGVIQKLDIVLLELAKAGPSLKTIIIDEAWGAWSYFDKGLFDHTALAAGRAVNKKFGVDIVVTQSAHKSLFALRQTSYLHCIGSKKLIERLKDGRYRLHTSSPSYPLLASLDLAREMMHTKGFELVERSKKLANYLRQKINNELNIFNVIDPSDECDIDFSAIMDLTKVWVRVEENGITGAVLRDLLFKKFNIYTNRYSAHSILFNIHIGLTEADVESLLKALKEIEEIIVESNFRIDVNNEVSSTFIIPYPPGVPLVVPGELISEKMIKKLSTIRDSGMDLIFIDQ